MGRWKSEEYEFGDVRIVGDPWAQFRFPIVLDDAISDRPVLQHIHQLDVSYGVPDITICGYHAADLLAITVDAPNQLLVDKDNISSVFFATEPIPEIATGSLYYSWP